MCATGLEQILLQSKGWNSDKLVPFKFESIGQVDCFHESVIAYGDVGVFVNAPSLPTHDNTQLLAVLG